MGRTLDRAISTPFMESAANMNIVINGGMEVSQVNGTTQVTVTNSTNPYTVDQWLASYTHAAATAVFKFQQVAPPGTPAFGAGFPSCLQLTATTLSAMAGAGDFAQISTTIEGYRWSKLGFGSAVNPQYVTIGFWVYATVTGTATAALRNSGAARSYPVNFTVNSALTWEYKTITIPADVAGTWLKDNGVGAYVTFTFGAGSTYQGTNATWQAANAFATSATTNFFASNSNTVCITGVGMWPGTDAPIAARSPFAQRPYSEELLLCKRYYNNDIGFAFESPVTNTSDYGFSVAFPPMRAVPTLTVVDGTSTNMTGVSALSAQPSGGVSACEYRRRASGTGSGALLSTITANARL